jgi:hypothetical protein
MHTGAQTQFYMEDTAPPASRAGRPQRCDAVGKKSLMDGVEEGVEVVDPLQAEYGEGAPRRATIVTP